MLTKEEWTKAEEALKSLFSIVRLRIDGYDVSIALARVGTYKNAIAIYVNGVFNSEWLFKDCEERRRFICRKERSSITVKQKTFLKKLSKRSQKELLKEHNNFKYEYFTSHWTSFNALKKHLIANNENIKLVSIT